MVLPGWIAYLALCYKEWGFYMDVKRFVILMSLLIALIISLAISYLVICRISVDAEQALYELYEVYVVSGFISTCLIVLGVLRYTLSKKHCS